MSLLHPKQFEHYQPAAQEGKAASDWLATDEGHEWTGYMHEKTGNGDLMMPDIGGFFSIKTDRPNVHEWRSGEGFGSSDPLTGRINLPPERW